MKAFRWTYMVRHAAICLGSRAASPRSPIARSGRLRKSTWANPMYPTTPRKPCQRPAAGPAMPAMPPSGGRLAAMPVAAAAEASAAGAAAAILSGTATAIFFISALAMRAWSSPCRRFRPDRGADRHHVRHESGFAPGFRVGFPAR